MLYFISACLCHDRYWPFHRADMLGPCQAHVHTLKGLHTVTQKIKLQKLFFSAITALVNLLQNWNIFLKSSKPGLFHTMQKKQKNIFCYSALKSPGSLHYVILMALELFMREQLRPFFISVCSSRRFIIKGTVPWKKIPLDLVNNTYIQFVGMMFFLGLKKRNHNLFISRIHEKGKWLYQEVDGGKLGNSFIIWLFL